MFVLLVVK